NRNNFVVADNNFVVYFKVVHRYFFFLTIFQSSNCNGEVRFIITVKRHAVESKILKPTAYQHKKYQSASAVEITCACMGNYFIRAAKKNSKQSAGNRNINRSSFMTKCFPRLDQRLIGTVKKYRQGKQQIHITEKILQSGVYVFS